MKKVAIVDDLSALTGISPSALSDYYRLTDLCIAHAVKESSFSEDEDTYIDIGIGTLIIRVEPEEIKYRFVPSRPLKNAIEDSLQNENDVLIDAVNLKIKERFEKTYKELL